MWEEGCAAGLMEQCQHDQDLQQMESVVEEVFEVQTYQPFHGWAFERFCDRSGNTFPALSEAAMRIAADDKLNRLGEDIAGLEMGVLPSRDWMWSHAWMHDDQYTQCDDDGWSYGSTIARINRHLAEGTSHVRREYYHFRRRRRWIRTRIKKPTLGEEAQPASAIASGDSTDATEVSTTAIVLRQQPSLPHAARYYRVYHGPVLTHLSMVPSLRLANFDTVSFSDDDVLDEGWLGQRGFFSRSWKLRYFILRHDMSTLVCLRDRASLVQISETMIDHHTTITIEQSANPQQFQFVIVNGRHQLWLNAVDEARRASWISSISELIVRKRASFFVASEGSESGLGSVRTNSYRRARSYNDSSWRLPKCDSNDSTFSALQDTSEHKRKRRRGWRPYRIIPATMLSRSSTDEQVRQEGVAQFEVEFARLVETLHEFLLSNMAIFEENLQTTEQFLAPAVEKIRLEHMENLHHEVEQCVKSLDARMKQLASSGQGNVMQCNILRKQVLCEATRVNNMILTCAQPLAQATVKKVSTESPASKRRIPMDWFRAPIPHDMNRRFSDDAVLRNELSSFSESLNRTPHTDGTRSPSIASTRSRNHSFTEASSSQASSPAPWTAGMKVKPFRSMPIALCQGHMSELPSGLNDYVFLVHERDVGSIIGFTLCSNDYVKALESDFKNALVLGDELRKEEARMLVHALTGESQPRDSPTSDALYLKKLEECHEHHPEVKFEYGMGSTKHELVCMSYYAAQFHSLRVLSGHGNFQYLCSIAQSHKWIATGGKSGAFFSLTHDKRFVLKGIHATEFNMFLHTAPQYFRYMAHAIDTNQPTVLSKILGLYKLTHTKRHSKHITYVVVMENVRYSFPQGQIYDIKGLRRRRYSGSQDDEETVDSQSFVHSSPMQGAPSTPTCRRSPDALPVLLDGNLMERIPIPVRQADLTVLEAAIQNDTNFLCVFGVIDYSMLMVFDEDNRQVGVGLIDYLHQYDFLKKMESGSKASLTFRDPTIVSPGAYQRRFVNAMHRYLVGIEEDLEARIRRHCHARVKQTKLHCDPDPQILNSTQGGQKAVSIVEPATSRPHRSRSLEAFPPEEYDHNATLAFSEGCGGFHSPASDEPRVDETHTTLMAIFPDLLEASSVCSISPHAQARP